MPILSAIHSAAVIVNSSLKVLDENKMVQNMPSEDRTYYFDNQDGLTLAFKDTQNTENLHTVLSQMEKRNASYAADFITLKQDNTRERRIIHIIALPSYFVETETDPKGHRLAFLLIWRRMLADRQINFNALRREYGLSPAEALVAHAVGRGQTTEEFALQRRISKVTARNQLRNACIKLGVSRQAEIAVMLSEIGAFSPLVGYAFNGQQADDPQQGHSPAPGAVELSDFES